MEKQELIEFARKELKEKEKAKLLNILLTAWENNEPLENKLQEQLDFIVAWYKS